VSIKSPGNGGALASGGAGTLSTVTLTAAAPTVAAAQVGLGSTVAATATAGSGGALPITVQAYLIINVAGTQFKVPYFAV
jgi:hypothetical protein